MSVILTVDTTPHPPRRLIRAPPLLVLTTAGDQPTLGKKSLPTLHTINPKQVLCCCSKRGHFVLYDRRRSNRCSFINVTEISPEFRKEKG